MTQPAFAPPSHPEARLAPSPWPITEVPLGHLVPPGALEPGRGPMVQDIDPLASVAPTTLVTVAGRLCLFAGLLLMLLGVQTLSNLRLAGLYVLAPVVMVALGAVAAGCGWALSRGRGWAAFASVGLAASSAVLDGAWTVWALGQGYVSLMSFIVAPFAVAGAVLAGMSIAHCVRADAARARLTAEGLELGF